MLCFFIFYFFLGFQVNKLQSLPRDLKTYANVFAKLFKKKLSFKLSRVMLYIVDVWIHVLRLHFQQTRVFSFFPFFFKISAYVTVHCPWTMILGVWTVKNRVNSNFSHIKKLFCYSVFSFSKNKLYPNGLIINEIFVV